MKKTTLLALALATTPLAQATLLLEETFDYAANSNLGAANAQWAEHGTGSDNIAIVEGNLSLPGLKASAGNAISLSGSGLSNYRTFAPQTSGTVYFSFLLNVTSTAIFTGASGNPLVSLLANNNATGSRGAGVHLHPQTGGYSIGFNRVNSVPTAGGVSASGLLSVGETYLIVASYQIVAGGSNDIMSIWINPNSSTFGNNATMPSPTFLHDTGGSELSLGTGIGAISIMQGNGAAQLPSTLIDELRVGTTWADVTPQGIPEPAGATALFGLFAIGCAGLRRRNHR